MPYPCPPAIIYSTENEYRAHFNRVYCKGPIKTFDSIDVFFKRSDFDHAFYESSKRNKVKDQFSHPRAQRIDWIMATLQNPMAELYCGWDNKKKKSCPKRRVAVVYEEYVVVIRLINMRRGQFVTAYLADNSIQKIRRNPTWET